MKETKTIYTCDLCKMKTGDENQIFGIGYTVGSAGNTSIFTGEPFLTSSHVCKHCVKILKAIK